jgi:hypothetical protein
MKPQVEVDRQGKIKKSGLTDLSDHALTITSLFRRWFWKISFFGFGVWLFVFTTVWSYVTDLVVHGSHEIASASAENPLDFRDYVKKTAVIHAICSGSNWIAELTRPLVPDEVLVTLWKEQHVQWEKIIRDAPAIDRRDFKNLPDGGKSLGLRIVYGSQNGYPESAINFLISDSVGRVQSGRACVGKGPINKYIEYYPNVIPVVYEGRVMPPSILAYHLDARNIQMRVNLPGIELVADTDITLSGTYAKRRLNERWFIVRNAVTY